jgi:Fe-S-cluster containining protein
MRFRRIPRRFRPWFVGESAATGVGGGRMIDGRRHDRLRYDVRQARVFPPLPGPTMNRDLRKLYRECPPMRCNAGCFDCCGPVPWHPDELARVKDRVPAEGVRMRHVGGGWHLMAGSDGMCPFASSAGCAVYDDRPLMCRLFGTARDKQIACPHGCRPARPISDAKAAEIRDRYRES